MELYEDIINQVPSPLLKKMTQFDSESINQAFELLPIFQNQKNNDDDSEKQEVASILMFLDFITRRHSQVMSKEPIRSRTLSLIQALQDYDKPEEQKEISMPNAFYGVTGQKCKCFEKQGENQMQLNIPGTFKSPIVYQ